MFEHDNFEKKIKEIERQNEAFEREKKQVFENLRVTPSQIHEILKNRSQYSEEDWKKLQTLQEDLDKQLQMKLENIRDAEKAKNSYNNRNLPPWALFCK